MILADLQNFNMIIFAKMYLFLVVVLSCYMVELIPFILGNLIFWSLRCSNVDTLLGFTLCLLKCINNATLVILLVAFIAVND